MFKKTKTTEKSIDELRETHIKVLKEDVEKWKQHFDPEAQVYDRDTAVLLLRVADDVAIDLYSLECLDCEFAKKLKAKNEKRLSEILKFKYMFQK